MVFPKFACKVLKKMWDILPRVCFFIQYAVHLLNYRTDYVFNFIIGSQF